MYLRLLLCICITLQFTATGSTGIVMGVRHIFCDSKNYKIMHVCLNYFAKVDINIYFFLTEIAKSDRKTLLSPLNLSIMKCPPKIYILLHSKLLFWPLQNLKKIDVNHFLCLKMKIYEVYFRRNFHKKKHISSCL